MTKAKLYLLSALVVATGLLLGGNVNADTTTVTATSATTTDAMLITAAPSTNDTVQDQIQSIREKIQSLTAEIKNKQQPPVVLVARPTLTQGQLDKIEVAVKRITAETERIKAQVQILVRMRIIEAKIAAIRTQISAMTAGKTNIAQAPATTASAVSASKLNEGQKQARIAQIQKQIGELNQELQDKRAAEQAAGVVAEGTCTGPSCSSASSSTNQSITIEAAPTSEKTTEAAKPGFWQSIGEFVRKIFTF